MSFAYLSDSVGLLVSFVLFAVFDGLLLLFVSCCSVCVAVLLVIPWRSCSLFVLSLAYLLVFFCFFSCCLLSSQGLMESVVMCTVL